MFLVCVYGCMGVVVRWPPYPTQILLIAPQNADICACMCVVVLWPPFAVYTVTSLVLRRKPLIGPQIAYYAANPFFFRATTTAVACE